MEDHMESVRKKSIAIASGKGGVGKTMTSTNFALYMSQKGMRVGLIDVDPLSDISTLLDIQDRDLKLPSLDSIKTFKDCRVTVVPRLDLIFPQAKTSGVSILSLMNRLFGEFLQDLDKEYDFLIFDMPAGVQDEENMLFLDKMSTILMVTNPEPTAHVSAGGYIKKALEYRKDSQFLVWHNKYAQAVETDFRASDLLGNYNRNVNEEDRLEKVDLTDIAFIPADPTLDLLKSDPSIPLNILRNLQDNLRVMLELSLPMPSPDSTMSSSSFRVIRYYIKNHPHIARLDEYMKGLEEYLFSLLGRKGSSTQFFSEEQRREVQVYLQKVNQVPLRKELVRAWAMVDRQTREYESAEKQFSNHKIHEMFHYVDRALAEFLIAASAQAQRVPVMKNMASLLLFHFTLLKLFQSETVNQLIADFIPSRKDPRGRTIRDRHRQILNLVRNDTLYRKRYLDLLKMLRPLMEQQLLHLVNTFGLKSLLFYENSQKINRGAYVKLFSNFLHETIYSGLGVTVGFRYRPVSQKFRKGADAVLLAMNRKSA